MRSDWPPYPSATMGKGAWRTIIRILRVHGTQQSERIAASLERQIDEKAAKAAKEGGSDG